MRRLFVLACLLATAAPASAAPTITAHRGGALADGVPVAAENTLPAFRRAARHGWLLEFDVSLTKDRVPVVIHDDTLDRVSNCSGLVKERTAAQLRAECWVDVIGAAGATAPNPRHTPIPTLAEVLRLAARRRATISPEIKNIPPTSAQELTGPDDFDPDPGGFATTVSRALADSGFPQDRMIVQSFWPPNLDVARTYLPGAQLSFLTLEQLNDPGPEVAFARGYGWVSPGFTGPLHPAYVERAHAYGERVTVYTPDSREELEAALASGADAVITDDPVLAEDLFNKGV
ncbi:MAG: glycerophosphodiester phosphodiesterase [Solirubrobacteraceae bacterium]